MTARLCRIIMASSGHYKKVPDEETFIPATARPNQSPDQMWGELMKLKQ
jgi:hypothetical protein